jgi:hypothetical protein
MQTDVTRPNMFGQRAGFGKIGSRGEIVLPLLPPCARLPLGQSCSVACPRFTKIDLWGETRRFCPPRREPQKVEGLKQQRVEATEAGSPDDKMTWVLSVLFTSGGEVWTARQAHHDDTTAMTLAARMWYWIKFSKSRRQARGRSRLP